MPTTFAASLNRYIAARRVSNELCEVDCRKRNQLPSLTVTLSGSNYGICACDYVHELEDGSCISCFQGLDTGRKSSSASNEVEVVQHRPTRANFSKHSFPNTSRAEVHGVMCKMT
ncbi:hypothetical protein CLAIMM_02792 isoform 3 [Cladophialophora immunda]|nr:hypothetical protein CLAIMM_02792 isoform 1 [Cladophialophora immunda]OQU96758.1 hypothetical protein CLAIMM_02792 isoform 2 [Cladophialophora immunda]OQU96759.1 hypothetical protein CLAIMM_02792 isoform 3 [Cladophialophora immunda]